MLKYETKKIILKLLPVTERLKYYKKGLFSSSSKDKIVPLKNITNFSYGEEAHFPSWFQEAKELRLVIEFDIYKNKEFHKSKTLFLITPSKHLFCLHECNSENVCTIFRGKGLCGLRRTRRCIVYVRGRG